MGRKYAWRAICVLLAASGCAGTGTGPWPRRSPWDQTPVLEASQRRPPADPFPQPNGLGASLTRLFPGLSRNPEFAPVGNPFGDVSPVDSPRALARRDGSTRTAALSDEEYRIDDDLEAPEPARRSPPRSGRRLAAGPRSTEPDDQAVVRAEGDPSDDPAQGATVRRMPRLPVPIVVEVDPESVPTARPVPARPDRGRAPVMPGSISTGGTPARPARAPAVPGASGPGSDSPPSTDGAIANGHSAYPPSVRRTGRPASSDAGSTSSPRATLAQSRGSLPAGAGGTAIVLTPEFADAPPLEQGPPAEEAELRQAERARAEPPDAPTGAPDGPASPEPPSAPESPLPTPEAVATATPMAEPEEPAAPAAPGSSIEAHDATVSVPADRLPQPADPVADAVADPVAAPDDASQPQAEVAAERTPVVTPRQEPADGASPVPHSDDPEMGIAASHSTTRELASTAASDPEPEPEPETAVPATVRGVPPDPFAGMVVPASPGTPAARAPLGSGSEEESKTATDATPAARGDRVRPRAEAPKGRPRMPLVRAWRDGLSAQLPPVQFPAGYYPNAEGATAASGDGATPEAKARARDAGPASARPSAADGPPRPRRGWGLGLIRRWRDNWEENHPSAEAAKRAADDTTRR